MKDEKVQQRLNKLANKFSVMKKFKAVRMLEDVIEAMMPIGGITGFNVTSYGTMTLCNHTANYNLPIKYEEYTNKLSSFGKRAYTFLENLNDYLVRSGADKGSIQYHLGKEYSSKHHEPTRG